jgi:hypothetical protein
VHIGQEQHRRDSAVVPRRREHHRTRCTRRQGRHITLWLGLANHSTSCNQQLNYNSVVWSQAENGDPLVCVTGDSRIKVLNVRTGKLATVCSISLVRLHVLTLHVDADRSWRCIYIYSLMRPGLSNTNSLSTTLPYPQ